MDRFSLRWQLHASDYVSFVAFPGDCKQRLGSSVVRVGVIPRDFAEDADASRLKMSRFRSAETSEAKQRRLRNWFSLVGAGGRQILLPFQDCGKSGQMEPGLFFETLNVS